MDSKGKPKTKTIDEYISAQPKNVQHTLQQLRTAIREAAPCAEEIISYQMPAFRQKDVLVWFAAFKDHIGFFPKASGIEAFQKELACFETSKGTVRFPLDKPIPLDLVQRIVKYRIKEISSGKKVPLKISQGK